jgi:hypothetical protein
MKRLLIDVKGRWRHRVAGDAPGVFVLPTLLSKEQSLRHCEKNRGDYVLMYTKISEKTCVGRNAGFCYCPRATIAGASDCALDSHLFRQARQRQD